MRWSPIKFTISWNEVFGRRPQARPHFRAVCSRMIAFDLAYQFVIDNKMVLPIETVNFKKFTDRMTLAGADDVIIGTLVLQLQVHAFHIEQQPDRFNLIIGRRADQRFRAPERQGHAGLCALVGAACAFDWELMVILSRLSLTAELATKALNAYHSWHG